VDVTKAGKGWRTLMIVAAQIGVAVALIYSWHYATVVGWMDPFFFSTPQRVGRTLVRIFQTGLVWKHVGATLHATVVGFLLGGSGGVLVGLLLSRSQVALSIANPFVFFFYSLPRIAIAPLFIVLLGLGIKSKIATVIFTVFFIMLINTIAGVRNIQPIWIQSARIMGASPSQISLYGNPGRCLVRLCLCRRRRVHGGDPGRRLPTSADEHQSGYDRCSGLDDSAGRAGSLSQPARGGD
jgi:ABC-type nitrate/sulfonate/bicarbonate transport system permease component